VGEKDPVHNGMLGLAPLIERYEALNFKVTLKIYPEGRHETLNELNRDEVLGDLLSWIEINGHRRRR